MAANRDFSIIPADEPDRLAAVRRYDVLDTPPDGAFDRITAIAARRFGVPIAIISVVDQDRIWFKSHHGLDVKQIGRDPGLCASAILSDIPHILPDAIEGYPVARQSVGCRRLSACGSTRASRCGHPTDTTSAPFAS